MNRINPDIDVVMDILKAMLAAKPDAAFIKSLYQQYCERGGLSKAQLQGLYSKAAKLGIIPVGKMATLEAIILKKHAKHKSDISLPATPVVVEDSAGPLIRALLEKVPAHKRVLFLQSKHERNDLSPADLDEIKKFSKLLL
ncbi:MAG: hypothetical protein JWQ27_1601 [Ferruginibacter sp.]|nr:hypothetical protein [Ferruginibacter sp.]